jgi:hypothetical protein
MVHGRRARQRRRRTLVVASIVVTALIVWLVSAPNHGPRKQSSSPLQKDGVATHRKPPGNRKGESSTKGHGTTATTSAPVTTTTAVQSSLPFIATVNDYVDERADTVTAALYDINTSQTYELHPGVAQAEASVVKVDIMATLLSQGTNTTTTLSTSSQQLLTGMIEESDNDSATALWDQVGGPDAINSFNQRIDMTATTPSQCVTCPNFPWPGWGLTTTTAEDQVKLLRQFVFMSPVLTTAERTFGLGLMENVTSSEAWGVTGGVPAGVTVALKNGWLPLSGESDWQVNSIGWIEGDGRSYILAVLTTGNPTEQYGIDTINEISSEVWNELG